MARAYSRIGSFSLIDEEMLITRVEFEGSREGGQTTKITLGTKGAIDLTPEGRGMTIEFAKVTLTSARRTSARCSRGCACRTPRATTTAPRAWTRRRSSSRSASSRAHR